MRFGWLQPIVAGALFALALTPAGADATERWIGTAPICDVEPSDCAKYGMEAVRSSKRGDGKKCTFGKKILCRAVDPKPGQRWLGTAPLCKTKRSDCADKLGMRYVLTAKCGDGNCCVRGSKVLCAPDPDAPPGIWLGTAPACDVDRSDCEALGMTYAARYRKGSGKPCLTGSKVLCRLPERPGQAGPDDAAHALTVLSYNIFARPFLVTHDGQVERTCRIPRAIAAFQAESGTAIDVIAFSEAFIDGCTAPFDLKYLLSYYGWPHSTEVVSGARVSNGGVFIASRWPIVASDQHVFKACALNEDCLAAKGISYARVKKSVGDSSVHYNVFATHFQARTKNDPSRGVNARIGQARELAGFVEKLGISTAEPVVLAGDFNIDWNNESSAAELNEVRRILNADLPGREGGMGGTYIGDLAKPKDKPSTWLDYVMYSRDYRRPAKSSMTALRLRPASRFDVCMSAKLQPYHVRPRKPWCGKITTISSLSDHAPVLARFRFAD